MNWRSMKFLLSSTFCVSLAMTASRAHAAPTSSPVLQAEVSDTATLPPIGPHWFIPSASEETYQIYDIDKGKVLGTIPATMLANIVIAPDKKNFYVAETIWSRSDHGTRQDLLQVYDAKTLSLTKEIELPPRALAVFAAQDFAVSSDNKWGFIFNMSPATSVSLVDLKAGKVAQTVDIPGCALVYPWKTGGFSSLCGNGSLTNVAFDGGSPTVTHTKPFFDSNNDPVFEQAIVDQKTGQAIFISYTGKVYTTVLGPDPKISAPWSLQEAAGLPAVGTGVQELAWRPGGQQPFAWNAAKGELFVLMHPGNHWSHKTEGSQVWVFNVAEKKLLRRIDLPQPASGIAASPDNDALLYATGHRDGPITVINSSTGDVIKTIPARVGAMSIAPGL